MIAVEEVQNEPRESSVDPGVSTLPDLGVLLLALGLNARVTTAGRRGGDSLDQVGTLTGARSNLTSNPHQSDVVLYLNLTTGSDSSVEIALREGDQIIIAGFTNNATRSTQILNQKTRRIAVSALV